MGSVCLTHGRDGIRNVAGFLKENGEYRSNNNHNTRFAICFKLLAATSSAALLVCYRRVCISPIPNSPILGIGIGRIGETLTVSSHFMNGMGLGKIRLDEMGGQCTLSCL